MSGEQVACLTYRNHRGELVERTVTPVRIWFGETEWHPSPQWLLEVFDHDRDAVRNYSMENIVSWRALDR